MNRLFFPVFYAKTGLISGFPAGLAGFWAHFPLELVPSFRLSHQQVQPMHVVAQVR